METAWFCLIAFMLTVYVVLDGYDLGTGVLHLWIGRTTEQRTTLVRTIAPVWDGNEVWLVAAAGSIFCAFPVLYAAAFSGFYLPLMIVLWLIAGRALGIEFRRQIESPLWTPAWDAIFALSSAALALVFGVALGNVVRGVPIDEHGDFFEPLWTNPSPDRATGILDGYTALAGLTALASLAQHGALWIAFKTEGELRDRARRAVPVVGAAVLVLTIVLSLWSLHVQPHLRTQFGRHAWGWLFPVSAAAGWAAAQGFSRYRRDLPAFGGSCLSLAGMMASVAFGLYPYVLPASTALERGLTADTAAADAHGLGVALAWWIPGIALAIAYSLFVHWKFGGKSSAAEEEY